MPDFSASSVETAISALLVGFTPYQQLSSAEQAVSALNVLAPPAVLMASTETATSSLTISGAPENLIARDVLSEVLRLWGCDNCDSNISDCLKKEALSVVNGTLQFIHAKGRELPYLTRRSRVYFFPANITRVELESDVQAVDGNIHGITPSISEVIYYDTDTNPPPLPFTAGGKVQLYFVHTSLEVEDITFVYGTDFTDAESLRQAIQNRIVNGATCFVDYAPGQYLRLLFDHAPKMLVDFPIAGGPIPWQIRAPELFQILDAADSGTESENEEYDDETTLKPASPAASRALFDNHVALYSTTGASTAPLVYYVEREFSANADSSRARLLLGPAKQEPRIFSVDVSLEPARVTWADFVATKPIPIPHRYVESLLLPIARWRATSSNRYRQRERHQALLDQYQEALEMLGVIDPQVTAVSDGKEAKSP